MEAEVLLDRILLSVCFLFDIGAPRSSGVSGSTSSSSAFFGFGEFVVPLPVPARRRCRCTVPGGDVASDQDGVVLCGAGWRRSAEERRLPRRMGGPPSPSLRRRSGRFRRRNVLFGGDDARVQHGLLCNFFCCLDFSVRILV